MNQRLQLVGVCMLIICLVLTAGSTTAQSSDSLAIEYENNGAGASGPSPFTENLQVAVTDGTFEYGPNASTKLRIVNQDTGNSVTFTPNDNQPTTTIQTGGEIDLDPNDVIEGDTLDVTLAGPDTDFTDIESNITEGSIDTFGPDTFEPYVIQIVGKNGAVITETEAQLHGVQYEAEFAYNESALTVTRDPEVQDDWFVVLDQEDTQKVVLQPSPNREVLVASTEGTGFNASKSFSIDFYRNESDSLGQRLLSLFYVGGAPPESEVDGPLNTSDDPPETEPSIPDDAVYRPDSAAADFDADADGQISLGELATAAGGYSNGNLTLTELANVAAAYSQT